MGLNLKSVVDAELAGQSFFSTWRKSPIQTTGSGIWFDLSMSPGNPVPNYYIGAANTATALRQSTDGGIPHGGNLSGSIKYLKTFGAMVQTAAAVPLPMMLLDYLLFYPFVDMLVTDQQDMINTVTLPRWTTGEGVKIMAVEVAGQLGVGNPQFTIGYTNSTGVTGRHTPPVACNTQVVNGTIITASTNTVNNGGLFIPLQKGDTGIRSIDSVTFLTADVGLIALVLVKPMENMQIRTIDAVAERVPLVDFTKLPVIADDAYLNLVCLPAGTIAASAIHGYIQTIWI